MSDLGDGRFDGAFLAQNFENLQPEKAVWKKYAQLYAHVDDERDRFLEFERWWNGYYTLSRNEILTITQNLFIGNRIESGEIRICEGCTVNLRRIRKPLVIFASRGDNITPPEQALGWIPQVWPTTAALKADGQRIVYLTHDHIGHLGIFVSASVARVEHRAILESLEEVEALAPGLYEMVIEKPDDDPRGLKPASSVRFEPREVSDLGISGGHSALELAAQVSRINEAGYDLFLGPWLRALTSPASAEALRALHPMRWTRTMFSERYNPWISSVKSAAGTVREQRVPLDENHPALRTEHELFELAAKQSRPSARRATLG